MTTTMLKVKESLISLFFFSTLVIIWCCNLPLFWQISYSANQCRLLQLSFILALTGKIWYMSNDILKDTRSDLVARELNSLKVVHFQETEDCKSFFHLRAFVLRYLNHMQQVIILKNWILLIQYSTTLFFAALFVSLSRFVLSSSMFLYKTRV